MTEQVFQYDPYAIQAHAALARAYAKRGEKDLFARHLSVCYDMDPEGFDRFKKDPLMRGRIPVEGFEQICLEIDQNYLRRWWNVISFSEIAPRCDTYSVSLHWEQADTEKVRQIYDGFGERPSRYFHADMGEWGYELQGTELVLESDADRYYCHYGQVVKAIRDLAPYVRDVRFLMSTECGLHLDEIWIVDGVFYSVRHPNAGETSRERLQVLELIADDVPDDRGLRRYLAHRMPQFASFFIDQYRRKQKTDPNASRFLSDAQLMLEKAFGYDPESTAALYQSAELWLLRDQTDEAIKEFEQVLEREPRHFDALYTMGKLHFEAERCEEAIEMFSRAIEVKPGWTDLHLYRGMAHQAIGEEEKAEADHLKDIEGIKHYNAGTSIKRGWRLFHKGSIALARLYFEAVGPKNRIYEADLKEREAKSTSPTNFYQNKYEEISKRETRALIGKGACEFHLGEFELAVDTYQALLDHDPKAIEGYNGIAATYFRMKDYQRALESYRACLVHFPNTRDHLAGVGSALVNLGRYDEVEPWLDKAIACDSSYYYPFYIKACLYALTGRVEPAIEMIEHALMLDPTQREMMQKESDFSSILDDPRLRASLFP